eukprot:jgi/Picsp_1/379/NSC_00377-R1_expressed protein [Chlorella variabilis]
MNSCDCRIGWRNRMRPLSNSAICIPKRMIMMTTVGDGSRCFAARVVRSKRNGDNFIRDVLNITNVHHSNGFGGTQRLRKMGRNRQCSDSMLCFGMVAGSDDLQAKLTWTDAIVIENKEASVDGSMRSLVLSVSDEQGRVNEQKRGSRGRTAASGYGRSKRWLDSFTSPGQAIAVNIITDDTEESAGQLVGVADTIFHLSTSPYETRMSSAQLDAAIVEILVQREGSPWEEKMASFTPGTKIQVSQVLGKGYSSLLDASIDLSSSLEKGRAVIFIAIGAQGLAAARSAMAWTPIQAHASTHKVAIIAHIDSQVSAPFLVEFDGWRDAGITVRTVSTSEDSLDLEEAIKLALYSEEIGIRSLAQNSVICLSGVPLASPLTRSMTKVFKSGGFTGSNLLLP